MEIKKSDKANLENKKGIFLEIGYVLTLMLILLAFEWSTKPDNSNSLGELEDVNLEEQVIPITRQKEKEPPPPPPPPKTVEQFKVVDNNVEIEDEALFEDTEADQETQVEIVEFESDEEEAEQEVFFVVEDMPTFQGKDKDYFRTYIQKNLRYPTIAAENGISGRVYVQFVVNKRGEVTNVRVVRGVDPSLDKEAVRVIKSSPKWGAGKQRGQAVSVGFTFPIVFQLQ